MWTFFFSLYGLQCPLANPIGFPAKCQLNISKLLIHLRSLRRAEGGSLGEWHSRGSLCAPLSVLSSECLVGFLPVHLIFHPQHREVWKLLGGVKRWAQHRGCGRLRISIFCSQTQPSTQNIKMDSMASLYTCLSCRDRRFSQKPGATCFSVWEWIC